MIPCWAELENAVSTEKTNQPYRDVCFLADRIFIGIQRCPPPFLNGNSFAAASDRGAVFTRSCELSAP